MKNKQYDPKPAAKPFKRLVRRFSAVIVVSALLMAVILFPYAVHYVFYAPVLYTNTTSKNADVLIFSYDRPLQLHALLESQEKFVSGISSINVLYLSSSPEYEKGYNKVQKHFPSVRFFRESKELENFKPLTLDIIRKTPADFILFAVDDDIVTAPIDLQEAVDSMIKTEAYAFLFRMGKNITSKARPPLYSQIEGNKMLWVLQNGQWDWHYGHNVDYSLYKKEQILPQIEKLSFSAPNSFEDQWNRLLYTHLRGRPIPWSPYALKRVLSYSSSKVINIPLNLVNEEIENKHMKEYPKEKLLEQYLRGETLQTEEFEEYLPSSPHVFVHPTFGSKVCDEMYPDS